MDFTAKYPALANLYRRLLVWGSRTIRGIDPDKVVFSSYLGKQYGDNPRCISERLHERYPKAKIVWLFDTYHSRHVPENLPDYAKPLYILSKEAFCELGTARVWVDNFTKVNVLRHPKGRQFYVQTWHGDRAIKKICYDIGLDDGHRIEEECDRVLTASAFGERMYRTAFRYHGEYIRAGSPRNDILVKNDPADIARVRAKLNIPEGTKLLLYAPTYRDNDAVLPKRAQMDLDRTLRCLEEKTGGPWMCMYRTHYFTEGIDLDSVKDRIVDVTAYDDMAELLLAADMVLTDYSSCALDYILRDKPALFYIADWAEYVSTRGVYFDVREAPFFTAENQDALEALIRGLTEEKVRRNCADIREYFGYYETGRATDAACDYIIERLGSRRKFPD